MFNWRKPAIYLLLCISGSKVPTNLEKIRKKALKNEDQQKAFQNQMLKRLLQYAALHVPYYCHILKQADVINQKNEVELANFPNLPFLTKEIIREKGGQLYSDEYTKRGSYFNTSGGSTGEPVRFLQDKYYYDWNVANKLYYAEAVGKTLGEKEIKLWGSEKDILEGSIGWREKLQNWLYNRKLLNAFMMSNEDLSRYVMEFNTFKPKHVWTYVDSIFQLAQYIDKNNLHIYSPQSIITTAGVLTDEVREYIERIFQSKVYNQYGSREVGDIAVEHPYKTGLQLFPWSHLVEIINEEIVVTSLTNYSMPIIRYKIGDTGLFTNDRQVALATVNGRVTNHFRKKDGTVVHGEYFTHLFYFKKWVKRFKVIQIEYDKVICQIVLETNPVKADLRQITRDIKVVLGSNTKVDFEYVKEIKPTKSGKYLYTESKID